MRMISIMHHWQKIFDHAPTKTLERGDFLFRQEDQVRSMYMVQSGQVALERPLKDGTALTLHIATQGSALAEASLFATVYHCDAVARSVSQIKMLSRTDFLTAIRNHPDTALSLIETHAKAIQTQRARIEILRLRRVCDRLDAWLALHGKPQKGEWIKVADQIGVSPPALYRELARRQR